MLSTTFKYQLMTPFCLQTTWIIYGSIGESDIWTVTVDGEISAELNKVIKIVSRIDRTFRKALQLRKASLNRFSMPPPVNQPSTEGLPWVKKIK